MGAASVPPDGGTSAAAASPPALAPSPPPSPVAPAHRSLEWRDLDKRVFFLANPAVALALRCLQHPANVIKTRYQVQQRHALYASPTNTALQTFRTEGLRGFYRGFGTSGLMLVVQQIYIISYEFLRATERYTHPAPSESVRNAIAAAVSVLGVQFIANPVDVVSQRLMLQGQKTSNEPMQPPPRGATMAPVASGPPALGSGQASNAALPVLTARQILRQVWHTHGAYGLYAGFFISCAQFIPSASLWWSTYPIYRAKFSGALHDSDVAWPSWFVSRERLSEVAAGSLASCTTAVAMNPMDIIRTRTQVESKPAWAIFKHLLATEGARGMWKGTTARMAMLMPQGALSVWAYEFVKRVSAKAPLDEEDIEQLHHEVPDPPLVTT